MRIRSLVLAAATSLVMIPEADAVRSGPHEPTVVTAGRSQRTRRMVTAATPDRMIAAGLPGWNATVDRDTDVPTRMWGGGVAAPGAVASAAVAESAARVFLAKHIATLAPGATINDFTLVSNHLSNGTRSVGFQQHARGQLVVGGSIGFAFQADRLAMVGSTAVPNVFAPATPLLSRASAFTSAQTWLGTAGFAVRSRDPASAASAPAVIIPLIRPRTTRGLDVTYRLAHELAVEDAAQHERWTVWVDATTGAPIARRSTTMRGVGRVLYNVPVRGPQATRSPFPAALSTLVAGGASATTALDGTVSFSGGGPVSIDATASGPLVSVFHATGSPFSESKQLSDGGTVTFGNANDEQIDGQLAAFVHANVVKQFAKRLDPELAYIDQPLLVFVNEDDVCNAFSTGDDIHFFKSGVSFEGDVCENTARIADVVYHEFGHSWHINTIIPGVGQFHPSVSEGLADFTSALITNDSALARGFFSDRPTEPLRDLDPVGLEKRFPEDATGEPHDEGEIIGEALFDLKKALATKLGAVAGQAQIERIFVSVMKRSIDLPSTYLEALLGDDDDGDLTNGTPNKCEIDAAFALHGLADLTAGLGLQAPTRDGLAFTTTIATASGACAGSLPTVTSVVVDWNQRGSLVKQHTALTATGTTFAGVLPAQEAGTVIQYKVTYTLSTGTIVVFPQGNAAEPLLEFYVGDVTPIVCFDFENGAQGWTNNGQWQAGEPLGLAGDPAVAHTGTGVFGLDLDQDGVYNPDQLATATSPVIDVGHATHVRLQFHRWLNVEEAQSDRARIRANGTTVWTNKSGNNHTDREWRFSDVDVSGQISGAAIQLRFDITPNSFGELGGWNIDDVCIVEAILAGGTVGCGNGVLEAGETCDDSNTVDGDGCSAACQREPIGPGPGPGPGLIDDEDGTNDPLAPIDAAGCCSTNSSPVGPGVLGILLGLGLLRRRRRG